MNDDVSRSLSYGLAGTAAAIGVGGLLVPVRDVIGNTNVALVLVVVIVAAAALGGRLAGAMTAAAACLSFNFFHTRPLYTLRVHSDNDIWTIALLFIIGLAVGEVAVFARTNRTRAIIDRGGLAHLEAIGAMVAEDLPPDAVWPAVRAALVDELRLLDATFEPDGQTASRLPVLERNGTVEVSVMYWTREGMELPRDGVVLPVGAGARSYGQIALTPAPGRGTTPRPAPRRHRPRRPARGHARPSPGPPLTITASVGRRRRLLRSAIPNGRSPATVMRCMTRGPCSRRPRSGTSPGCPRTRCRRPANANARRARGSAMCSYRRRRIDSLSSRDRPSMCDVKTGLTNSPRSWVSGCTRTTGCRTGTSTGRDSVRRCALGAVSDRVS